jgi:transmembrane sensor
MKANQLLVASATGTTLRSVANASAWKNWRDGIVKFDNLPLAQAVAEMNRYSETQLEVADAATGRIVVSGAFNTGSTQAFVEALAIGFRVTSREESEGKIVLKYVG